jgi:hypothetical protein
VELWPPNYFARHKNLQHNALSLSRTWPGSLATQLREATQPCEIEVFPRCRRSNHFPRVGSLARERSLWPRIFAARANYWRACTHESPVGDRCCGVGIGYRREGTVSGASEIKSVACDKRRNVGAEPSALQSAGLVAALPRQGTLTGLNIARDLLLRDCGKSENPIRHRA